MSSQRLQQLSNTLHLTFRQHSNSKNRYPSRSKIHSERERSRLKYERLTNHSKDEQKALINHIKSARRPQWKHDYYRINKTFSVFDKQKMEPFPHNNDKYNVQFLDRTLRGRSLKFPAHDWGFFQKPQDKLFSDHYKPIVRNKRKYNEDYELRTSLFEKTWVDKKRDHIMDEYRLQANPFRTPASNTFISTMHKQKNYRKL